MRIDLSGKWEFHLGKNYYDMEKAEDSFHPTQKHETGERESERLEIVDIKTLIFEDTIILPSTTEISKKGKYFSNPKQKVHLNRKYPFTGKSYYRREVEIPSEWKGKRIELILERTKFTKIYWDGVCVSSSHETLIPQHHELKLDNLTGCHELIIEVDNDLISYPDFPASLYNGHQYTEHTQTNWNGILGEIYLEAYHPLISLEQVIVRKGEADDEVTCDLELISSQTEQEMILELQVGKEKLKEIQHVKRGKNQFRSLLKMPSPLELWDEFNPALYPVSLKVYVEDNLQACYEEQIGFYTVNSKEKAIWLNGKKVFLRGNIDCAIYPLTGAAPMDEIEWRKIFNIYKEYGLNHCRFHSWCPPKNAFRVADEMGIYLQVELSCFANGLYESTHKGYDEVLNRYLYDQAVKVVKTYGNHPSFILFAVGNEMVGDLETFNDLLRQLKNIRPDKLYSQGANNFLENPICCKEDQYWVTMRTTSSGGNIRASYSHGDLPLGHIQEGNRQGTFVAYNEAVEQSQLPLISHEIGQYQVFPNFNEIADYTGVLESTALQLYKEKFRKRGLLDLTKDFFEASGKLAVQCYKEDIETIFRTKGMSGFQLLSLQDYPGQGMALIGILDSFWKSKGLIVPETWRQFCNDQVVLAQFERYTYFSGETISLEVSMCNYGMQDLVDEVVHIELRGNSIVLEERAIKGVRVRRGDVSKVGMVELATQTVHKPVACELILKCRDLVNSYPIWIYPRDLMVPSENVYVTKVLDQRANDYLEKGKNVLLLSDQLEQSLEAGFTPDFWCYPMFKEACEGKGEKVAPGTMGLLIQAEHPALAMFPTDTYASWQWQQIVTKSKPVILDDRMDGYKIIAEVIDNFDRAHRLGLIYEQKVHKGKLIICTVDLLAYTEIPDVRQLYNSLLSYAEES